VSPFRGSVPFTEDWKNFRFEIEDAVATVTFDRPERLNALTFEAYADLRELLAELPHRDDVRVLVITGTGRGFCSGGDVEDIIGALQEKGAKELLDFTRMTGSVVQRMRECPLPIIAAVNGVAAGAGAVIALAADLRILARSARLSFLFTKVGLAGADMGSAYLLPRLVGLGRATELLLLGEDVEPARAAEIGLANKVVEDAALMKETAELATRLAEGPATAYATTKLLISRELDTDLAGALELEAYAQALLMTSDDHKEFYRAFTEGRDPKWRGT
jgi:enoyl-CoA hydratase/carnithine racemase